MFLLHFKEVTLSFCPKRLIFSGRGSVTDFQTQIPCLSQRTIMFKQISHYLKQTIMLALDKLNSNVFVRWVLLLQECDAMALLQLIVSLGSPDKGHSYLYVNCNTKTLSVYSQISIIYFILLNANIHLKLLLCISMLFS